MNACVSVSVSVCVKIVDATQYDQLANLNWIDFWHRNRYCWLQLHRRIYAVKFVMHDASKRNNECLLFV